MREFCGLEERSPKAAPAEYGKDFTAMAMAVHSGAPRWSAGGEGGKEELFVADRPLHRSEAPIVRCRPMEGQKDVEDEGIVREVIYLSDILHHLDLQEQSAVAQLLGRMGFR